MKTWYVKDKIRDKQQVEKKSNMNLPVPFAVNKLLTLLAELLNTNSENLLAPKVECTVIKIQNGKFRIP